MKSFVITITDLPQSFEHAQRCIDSGKSVGIDIEMFDAITPSKAPRSICSNNGISVEGFDTIYSRMDNAISCFLSHFTLWQDCIADNEEYSIFEHDAVIVNSIPEFIPYKDCINLGKPSYGKWKDPVKFGVNLLTSKAYFPGAHAYRLTPTFAKKLVKQAKIKALPTDVFLNKNTFPTLQEYYPWPVEVKDNFTTVQRQAGIRAKHGYNETYRII
jgi:GR25 family glycosyltransferase involved in LPS biosynthesis